MTFYHPILNEPIRFSENRISVLVMEHAEAMRSLLLMLRMQIGGETGPCVFAEKGELRELSKAAVLITDPFSLDWDAKRMLTKIFHAVSEQAEEYADAFRDIINRLNMLACEIGTVLDFDAAFEPLETAEDLIKLLGFHVDTENLSFPEGLIEYMKLQRRFFAKKLFVFYNLKSCLSETELAAFYRTVRYEKLQLLLIEDMQRKRLPEYEAETVLDKDLCIL